MFVLINKIYIIILFASTTLWALPSGSTVVTGGASVTTATNSVTVSTSSENNIINWSSFDLTNGQSITFDRTGTSAADTYYVFNQVTGSSVTSMDGSISSGTNGVIYLCNPNGVIIGSNGTVVTGGFLVAGLSLSGTFEPNTNLTFTGSGTVTVSGNITTTTGDATLIGYRVITNSGSSVAAQGTAAIGAGSNLIYRPAEVERIYIETTGTAATGTGIDHNGTISGGSVIMKADGNIYTLAINQNGVVQATSCTSGTNGVIRLIAQPANNKGALEFSGSISRSCTTTGVGPAVEIYGYSVALETGSSIDVSGVTGGAVTIGTSATTNLTTNVHMASGATITSTGTTGNGGAVNLYGDTSIVYLGSITTSSTSGNGGDITLNSPGYLSVDGSANASSTSGSVGTFTVLGPTVSVGAAANQGTYFAPPNYAGAPLTSVFTESSIEGILALGNVTVNATDIDVTTVDINWSSGNHLTLIASDQIDISKALVMTGSTFSGSDVLTLTSPLINIVSASDVGANLTSGDINVTASNVLLIQGSTNGSACLQTAAGDIDIDFGNNLNLRGSGGNALISGTTVTVDGQTAGVGDLSLRGEACGQANIIGTTSVLIGATTALDDVEVIAGACGSGLVTAITGGTVGITSASTWIQGGASGSGNIAYIRTAAGTQRNITLTTDSLTLIAGAAGTNNSARLLNSSSNGIITVTTTADVTLTAGGASTTASIADIYSQGNTLNVGGDLEMNGGGGVSSLASIYGYTGNTISATGDIEMYSGSALYTHARILAEQGDNNLTAGRSIYMYTGTSAHSNVYVTTTSGSVNYNTTHDIRMRGSCTIPNEAYVTAGGTGNINFTAGRDITRVGNTRVETLGSGTFTHSGGYTFTGCAIIPIVSGQQAFQYYEYDFLYELFYRLRYFGVYDWYLFHSHDFWLKHTFTAP
ncbi:MAG: hypothetical protein S4CHLAM20_01810 [Chlamydiia bacterium]|nr:hypothetical protein [Chlamydiia bacterium]